MLDLVQDQNLGIVLEDEEARDILNTDAVLRHSKDLKNIKYVFSFIDKSAIC